MILKFKWLEVVFLVYGFLGKPQMYDIRNFLNEIYIYTDVHLQKLTIILFSIYCLIIFLISLLYTILEMVDAFLNINNLIKLTENLCLTLTHIGGIFKVINITMKNDDVLNLIDDFCSWEEKYRNGYEGVGKLVVWKVDFMLLKNVRYL